jgi:formylglycine-generating enzyme required for sulfatase activity
MMQKVGMSGGRGVGRSGSPGLPASRLPRFHDSARVAALSIFLLAANAGSALAVETKAVETKPVVKRTAMAAIPAGKYHPLYADGAPAFPVKAFSIDREPVTRAQYLSFARSNPTWLAGVDPRAAALDRPMTGVTWYAARAYCAAQGKRLPTTAEWEYVAAADEKRRDATRDPQFLMRLVSLYTTRPEARAGGAGEKFRNVYGVSALHGVVWEWTADFDGGHDEHAGHGNGTMAGMEHGKGGHEHMLSCASAAIGASNAGDYAAFMRYQFRAGLTRSSAQPMLGFRCAI